MRLYAGGIHYYARLHQYRTDLPVFLLLHGFMGSGEVFRPLIKPLSRFCNPLTIDLAGHGKSTPITDDPSVFSAENQASQLRSVLERFALRDLFIHGYSMGGRIAFQLITRYPDFFKAAVIESAHCGIESPEERQARKTLDAGRAGEIEENFERFAGRWMKLPMFKTTGSEDYLSIIKQQKPEWMSASLRGFGSGVMPPVCSDLEEAAVPLYLTAGGDDPKYVSMMQHLGQILPQTKLFIVNNAGHRVHADQPLEWLRILQTLIENHHGRLENRKNLPGHHI